MSNSAIFAYIYLAIGMLVLIVMAMDRRKTKAVDPIGVLADGTMFWLTLVLWPIVLLIIAFRTRK